MELASQLSLLAGAQRGIDHDTATVAVGFWAAGERLVEVGGQPLPANVWFHFAADHSAVLSVRYRDQDRAVATFGQWSIADDGLLVAEFGKTVIAAPLSVQDDAGDIVSWAGEVLFRLPQDLPTEDPGTEARTARAACPARTFTVSAAGPVQPSAPADAI